MAAPQYEGSPLALVYLDLRDGAGVPVDDAALRSTIESALEIRAGSPFSSSLEAPTAFLQSLQRRLRDGRAYLDAGKAWRLPDPPTRWDLVLDPDTGALRKRFVATDETAFFYVVADLLVGAWPQVRRCANPTCGAHYVPSKVRQQYCSTSCSEKTRQARYAPKRQRDFKREYVQRVVKHLPPGARVKVAGQPAAAPTVSPRTRGSKKERTR